MKKRKNHTVFLCSFCGKLEQEVRYLIPGQEANICNNCVSICNKVIDTKTKKDAMAHQQKDVRLPTPKEIKSSLDEYVIGQEEIKKMLSVAVYLHYKRLYHNLSSGSENGVELEKANILLIGPTGSGKTLLASTLAKIVDVPFAIADATTLTEAGYVGDDVENILLRLIQNADYNIERAERGIVFIDEIDKISRKSESTSITRDVSGEGVQQALLKIIEGTYASVPARGGRKHPQSSNIQINTKNILFICEGAFVELEAIIKKRLNQFPIGFKNQRKESLPEDEKSVFYVNPDDLIKFGLIPELVGRLPVVGVLEELSDQQLRDVLLKPRNSIIKQYQLIFDMEGIKLEVSDDAINQIVLFAKMLKTGARGLRSIVEKVIFKFMYSAPGSDLKKISITEKTVIEEAGILFSSEKKSA